MSQPITAALLGAIYTAFNTAFRGGFAGVNPTWQLIATQVPSGTLSEKYTWLGQWPALRKWVGDRVIKELSAHGYTITNEAFESTISVLRDNIEDDQVGIFAPMFQEMGRATAAFPDELVFPLLPAGATALCYDGQPFFDDEHPMAGGVASNDQGGAGTAWYLLDTTRALKPLIYQTRRSFEFTSMDKPDDNNVFMRREYVYGVDGRAAAGYGFWQMAYRSKETLDATHYKAARAAMMALTDDEGKPLGIKPNLLVAPGSLEGEALALLNAPFLAGGATNVWAGTATPLISPYL